MTRDKKLDETDLKILRALQENGRMEIVHVASRVCRSPRSTLDRFEQLTQSICTRPNAYDGVGCAGNY